MDLGSGMRLDAQMHYLLRQRPGGWSVSTSAYRYRFVLRAEEVFLMHWHPDGRSTYRLPHLRLQLGGSREVVKEHLRTPRMRFEDAIEWAILLGGVRPGRDDWERVLETGRREHHRARRWCLDPEGELERLRCAGPRVPGRARVSRRPTGAARPLAALRSGSGQVRRRV
ncbi:hypothetical protein DEI86_15145 [Curtobacterium sp. MCBD17_028]|nr:hypothetical protein DEI86_15145 [Curtobacterium sp. MCBD17_028]